MTIMWANHDSRVLVLLDIMGAATPTLLSARWRDGRRRRTGNVLQMAMFRSKRCAAILQLPKTSAAGSAKLVSINGSCFFGLCTFIRLGRCSCACLRWEQPLPSYTQALEGDWHEATYRRCAAFLQLPKTIIASSATLVSINGSCFRGLSTFVWLGRA